MRDRRERGGNKKWKVRKWGRGEGGTESGGGTFQLFYINIKKEGGGRGGRGACSSPFPLLTPPPPILFIHTNPSTTSDK